MLGYLPHQFLWLIVACISLTTLSWWTWVLFFMRRPNSIKINLANPPQFVMESFIPIVGCNLHMYYRPLDFLLNCLKRLGDVFYIVRKGKSHFFQPDLVLFLAQPPIEIVRQYRALKKSQQEFDKLVEEGLEESESLILEAIQKYLYMNLGDSGGMKMVDEVKRLALICNLCVILKEGSSSNLKKKIDAILLYSKAPSNATEEIALKALGDHCKNKFNEMKADKTLLTLLLNRIKHITTVSAFTLLHILHDRDLFEKIIPSLKEKRRTLDKKSLLSCCTRESARLYQPMYEEISLDHNVQTDGFRIMKGCTVATSHYLNARRDKSVSQPEKFRIDRTTGCASSASMINTIVVYSILKKFNITVLSKEWPETIWEEMVPRDFDVYYQSREYGIQSQYDDSFDQ